MQTLVECSTDALREMLFTCGQSKPGQSSVVNKLINTFQKQNNSTKSWNPLQTYKQITSHFLVVFLEPSSSHTHHDIILKNNDKLHKTTGIWPNSEPWDKHNMAHTLEVVTRRDTTIPTCGHHRGGTAPIITRGAGNLAWNRPRSRWKHNPPTALYFGHQVWNHIDGSGLGQDCSNSSALVMELMQSCI